MSLLVLVPALAWGGLIAASAGPMLRHLPEPPAEDADGKPLYAALATRGFLLGVFVAGTVAAALVLLRQPAQHWLGWTSLAGPCLVAGAIDARTTWLPKVLTATGLLLAALGALAASVLANEPWPLVSAVVGAGACGGFFHVAWRVTGALGYGDVRLAAVIGAVAALSGWAFVAWAMVLGSIAGALSGIVHAMRRGRGAFPYGPGLLAGPFLALLLH